MPSVISTSSIHNTPQNWAMCGLVRLRIWSACGRFRICGLYSSKGRNSAGKDGSVNFFQFCWSATTSGVAKILFIQTSALYKSFTYLLTYLLTYMSPVVAGNFSKYAIFAVEFLCILFSQACLKKFCYYHSSKRNKSPLLKTVLVNLVLRTRYDKTGF